MKNLFIIFCLSFISSFAFAQSSNSTLDSMYYGLNAQYLNVRYYQYDNQNRVTEILSRNKDLPLTFQNRTRYEYLDNQTIETQENWLITAQQWEGEIQIITDFNDIQQKTKETILYWNNSTNTFEVERIINFEYDNQGNLIKEEVPNFYRYSWLYNAQNQLVEYRKGFWNANLNRLEPFQLQTKDYDDKNRLISEINRYQNTRIEQTFHTYDNKNRLATTTEILLFDNDTLYNYQTDYFYNSITNRLSRSVKNDNETLYSYDKFGNLSEVKVSHPYTYREDGVIESYIYNDDNLLVEQFVNEGLHSILEYFTYDENSELKTYNYNYIDHFCGNGSNGYQKTYFRSNNANLNESQETITCLFPNPYTNYQQVICDELAPEKHYELMVVNIAGQKVYETKFFGRNGFFINRQLDKGWYVFVVLEKGEIVTKQKILVF